MREITTYQEKVKLFLKPKIGLHLLFWHILAAHIFVKHTVRITEQNNMICTLNHAMKLAGWSNVPTISCATCIFYAFPGKKLIVHDIACLLWGIGVGFPFLFQPSYPSCNCLFTDGVINWAYPHSWLFVEVTMSAFDTMLWNMIQPKLGQWRTLMTNLSDLLMWQLIIIKCKCWATSHLWVQCFATVSLCSRCITNTIFQEQL